MKKWVLCIFALLWLSAVAIAQAPAIVNKCAGDTPVKLTVVSISTDTSAGTHPASVQIQNIGSKPISAVIVLWKLTDSSGALSTTTTSEDFAPGGSLLLPGQVASDHDADLTTATGMPATVEVYCQAVLFEGKGVYGDGKSAEVAKLRAVRQGIAAERRRLLHIYKDEGEVKLLSELNREIKK